MKNLLALSLIAFSFLTFSVSTSAKAEDTQLSTRERVARVKKIIGFYESSQGKGVKFEPGSTMPIALVMPTQWRFDMTIFGALNKGSRERFVCSVKRSQEKTLKVFAEFFSEYSQYEVVAVLECLNLEDQRQEPDLIIVDNGQNQMSFILNYPGAIRHVGGEFLNLKVKYEY